jgi:hypothetical protein
MEWLRSHDGIFMFKAAQLSEATGLGKSHTSLIINMLASMEKSGVTAENRNKGVYKYDPEYDAGRPRYVPYERGGSTVVRTETGRRTPVMPIVMATMRDTPGKVYGSQLMAETTGLNRNSVQGAMERLSQRATGVRKITAGVYVYEPVQAPMHVVLDGPEPEDPAITRARADRESDREFFARHTQLERTQQEVLVEVEVPNHVQNGLIKGVMLEIFFVEGDVIMARAEDGTTLARVVPL